MKVSLCVAGLAMLCLMGCGKSTPVQPQKEPPPRPVTLTPVQARDLERVINVTGTLAPREQSTLSTKVAGRLQQLNVDIGSVVKKGDVLARVEPRDFELGLQQAAAALAQARAMIGLDPNGQEEIVDWKTVSTVRQAKALLDEAANNRERVRNLFEARIAAPSELDAAEASYKVASTRYETSLEEARTRMATVVQRRAEYELAQKRLADTALVAPFDGAVQARPASLGEYVAAGTPIVKLVNGDPLRLRLQVPERHAALVRTGQVVRVLVEGDTNAYQGQVARLSPALEEDTRMLLVEADVPARGALRAGLFARAVVVVNAHEPGLTLPPQAVMTFAGIEKVVRVRDGRALEEVIATGRSGPGWVEILSDLKAGDQVILDPAGLRTGHPVVVGNEPPLVNPHESATPAS
jgi:RND family efflux transporter MFP subunit